MESIIKFLYYQGGDMFKKTNITLSRFLIAFSTIAIS